MFGALQIKKKDLIPERIIIFIDLYVIVIQIEYLKMSLLIPKRIILFIDVNVTVIVYISGELSQRFHLRRDQHITKSLKIGWLMEIIKLIKVARQSKIIC